MLTSSKLGPDWVFKINPHLPHNFLDNNLRASSILGSGNQNFCFEKKKKKDYFKIKILLVAKRSPK